MADKTRGRGRLSVIDLLPPECEEVIVKAASLLAARDLPQAEIYKIFAADLRAVQKEMGKIFPIPSKSAFNRYSLRLAVMTRRLEQTREIAASLSDRFNASASDDLTLIVAETIKTVIFETLSGGGTLEAKDVQALGNALKSALAAQSLSTSRRQKLEAGELAKKTLGKALDKMEGEAETKENSADRKEFIRKIREEIYGLYDSPANNKAGA